MSVLDHDYPVRCYCLGGSRNYTFVCFSVCYYCVSEILMKHVTSLRIDSHMHITSACILAYTQTHINDSIYNKKARRNTPNLSVSLCSFVCVFAWAFLPRYLFVYMHIHDCLCVFVLVSVNVYVTKAQKYFLIKLLQLQSNFIAILQ